MNVFKYFPLVLFVGIIALYCSGNYSNEANASGYDRSIRASIISVKTSGYGKDKSLATEDAEVNAIRQILFEGVSGTTQPYPLISDPESAKMQRGIYFSELLNQRYKNFIERSEQVSTSTLKGSKKVDMALLIDVKGLRDDLRNNAVEVR